MITVIKKNVASVAVYSAVYRVYSLHLKKTLICVKSRSFSVPNVEAVEVFYAKFMAAFES